MPQASLATAANLSVDELGALMKALRKRLNAARRARDPAAIDEAQALYNRCAAIMQRWIMESLRAIDGSDEVKELTRRFRDVTAQLKAEKKAVEDIQAALATAITIVGVLDGLLSTVLV